MNLPKVDLEELKEFRKKNFMERLDFIRRYARWVRRTPNKKWSAQQKEI